MRGRWEPVGRIALYYVFEINFSLFQFYEVRYRTLCRGYPWAGDYLPYGGRGLASADVAAL